MTLGNGSEFAEHALIDQALDEIYISDPFASWQHGSNENFDHQSDWGYRTPRAEFEASFNRVALRS